MLTFCTRTAFKRLTKTLFFNLLKFDAAPNRHVFETFRERLNLLLKMVFKHDKRYKFTPKWLQVGLNFIPGGEVS